MPSQKENSSQEMVPLIDEKEPNDYPAWAQYLPQGAGVRGFINREKKFPEGIRGDRDVYIIDVPGKEKKILWARLTAVPGVDTFIALFDSERNKIVLQDINGENSEELIVNVTLNPGKYHFRIGSLKKTGVNQFNLKTPYTLFWKLSTPVDGDEIEPNDRRVQANKIVLGKSVLGFISSSKDVDFYKISNRDMIYRIELNPIPSTAMTLSFWKDKDKGSIFNITSKKNDKLILRQYSARFFDYIGVMSSSGRYSLKDKYSFKISIESPSEYMEKEPNDLRKTANTARFSDGKIQGFIDHGKDTDVFSTFLQKDSLVSFRLVPPTGLKLEICLWGKKKICARSKGDEPLKIEHQFLSKGKHFIEIRSLNGGHPHTPYELEFSGRMASQGDEKEPNNKINSANPIKVDQPVKAYIFPKGDVDYFKFSFPGTLKNPPVLKASLVGGEGINPVLELYDSYGNMVTGDTRGVYNGQRSVKTPVHPHKTYYIKIMDRENSSENSKVPYELRLVNVSGKQGPIR